MARFKLVHTERNVVFLFFFRLFLCFFLLFTCGKLEVAEWAAGQDLYRIVYISVSTRMFEYPRIRCYLAPWHFHNSDAYYLWREIWKFNQFDGLCESFEQRSLLRYCKTGFGYRWRIIHLFGVHIFTGGSSRYICGNITRLLKILFLLCNNNHNSSVPIWSYRGHYSLKLKCIYFIVDTH